MVDVLLEANTDGIVLSYEFRKLSDGQKVAFLKTWEEYIQLELSQLSAPVESIHNGRVIYTIGNVNYKIDRFDRVFMYINKTWIRSSKTASELTKSSKTKEFIHG